MGGGASKHVFLFLLSLFSICSSGGLAEQMEELSPKKMKWKEQIHLINPSTTVFPTTPTSTPTIVTVPSTNPVTVMPASPWSTPATVPSTVPGGQQPITNPVTTYPTTPITNPVSSPAIPGQSWCVTKTGTQQTLLQTALDYACGIGGSDCSQIQQGGSCFFPKTLENHASFAFNSYFQRNPISTSCDFGGTAMVVNTNPSTGSCIYPLLSSPSSQSSPPSLPATTNPIPTPTPTPTNPIPTPTPTPTNPIPTPTPTTVFPTSPPSSGAFSSGSPPTPMILNSSNPASGSGTTTTTGFGSGSPPASSFSNAAASSCGDFRVLVLIVILVIASV